MGNRKAAKADAAQYAEQARVAGENAKLVDASIVDAIYRGRRQQQDVISEGRKVAGAQRTQMAAAGLDLEFGSPVDLIYNTQRAFMRDVATTRRNTQGEIRDLEREKLNFLSAQRGASMASSSTKKAGNLSALGSLFSTGGDIYAASIQ